MDARWITDWAPSTRFPHYTRSNAGEVLPTPASPLGQQFTFDEAICLGWRDGFVRMGYYVAEEFDPSDHDVVGFFGGYLYINLSNVRMQGVRSPVLTVDQLDRAIFGDHPDVPPYVAAPRRRPARADRVDRRPPRLGHVDDRVAGDRRRARADDRPPRRAPGPGDARRRLVAGPGAGGPAAAAEAVREPHVVVGQLGDRPGILAGIGDAIGDPTITMKLVAGIGDVDSAEPSYAMWELSRLVRVVAAS